MVCTGSRAMPSLTVNGANLHYELAGHGRPALVLIHGGCCAASDWRLQIDALSGEFTVLAMDLRGHGRSGGADGALTVEQWAADVNALVDALEIGAFVIVGHSLGSRIAAEAVWQRSGSAAGLILLDGSRTVGGLSATEPRPGFAETQGQDIGAILDRTIGPYADSAVRGRIVNTMTSPPEAVMWAAARALEDWDRGRADMVLAGLPRNLPVLAIQSTYHDRFTPRRSFARADESSPYLDGLRALVPALTTAVLPDTGHFSMMEQADAVTALIRDFGLAAMTR
jgi:pimeloyl-ACP methyl ester carboxylesterase